MFCPWASAPSLLHRSTVKSHIAEIQEATSLHCYTSLYRSTAGIMVKLALSFSYTGQMPIYTVMKADIVKRNIYIFAGMRASDLMEHAKTSQGGSKYISKIFIERFCCSCTIIDINIPI